MATKLHSDLHMMRFPADMKHRRERRAKVMALPALVLSSLCLAGLFGIYTGMARGQFDFLALIGAIGIGLWLIGFKVKRS